MFNFGKFINNLELQIKCLQSLVLSYNIQNKNKYVVE